MVFDSIPIALVLAVVVGIILRYGFWLADEAEYRADGQGVLRRLLRSQPSMVIARAFTLDVDGREIYYLEVNGEDFVHDDPDELVDDVVQYVDATVARRPKPRVDSREFGNYLFTFGIADPEDWDHKLDEVIRKAALQPFRSARCPVIGGQKRRVRRSKFDQVLTDFDDRRVQRRLRQDDLYRSLDLGDHWVTLERDPYSVDGRGREWPSLAD